MYLKIITREKEWGREGGGGEGDGRRGQDPYKEGKGLEGRPLPRRQRLPQRGPLARLRQTGGGGGGAPPTPQAPPQGPWAAAPGAAFPIGPGVADYLLFSSLKYIPATIVTTLTLRPGC
jgi:hypothetical protein